MWSVWNLANVQAMVHWLWLHVLWIQCLISVVQFLELHVSVYGDVLGDSVFVILRMYNVREMIFRDVVSYSF